MSDKTPASLTSSLLARKGGAAPSAENTGEADGITETASPAEGSPVAPEPQDSFLTRGPDSVVPDPEAERSPLGQVMEEVELEPPRSRRAPLIILAILLVFVLAGAGWFAASIFLRGGEESAVASARKPPATQSPHVNTGLQPVASQTTTLVPPPAGFATAQSDGNAAAQSNENDEPGTSASTSLAPVRTLEPVGPIAADTPRAAEVAAGRALAEVESGGGGTAPAIATGELSPSRAAPDPAPKPAKAADGGATQTETAEAAPVAKPVTTSPVPPRAEKVAEAPKEAAAPPPPKPPVRAAARQAGTHGVQLASVSTRAQANRAIEQLSRRFASVLDGTMLRVRTATLRDHGTVYRIQTAAVLSAADAKRMCAKLKAAKQNCFVFAQ